MVYQFVLPDVGEGIVEAEIVRWLVHEGEAVVLDQPLLEIQTDKAIVEVPAPVAGVIGQLGGAAGDVLHVGELLVTIAQPSDAVARVDAPSGDGIPLLPHSAQPSVLSPQAPMGRPLATPAVRKLARELGLDLTTVTGSGPSGRITAEDLRARAVSPPRGPAREPAGAETAPSQVSLPPQSPVLRPEAGLSGGSQSSVREPLRGLRRRTAEAMAESWRTIPHISGHDEIDVSALVALRERLKPAAESAGIHLTYLPFVVKAVVAALKRYPIVNASLDQAAGEIVYHHRFNIGIATATPDGLIVPVVHDADRKNLRDLQGEITELSELARSRRIGLAALQGGTFTITNFGSLGGWLGTPIIRPGEAAILGVGRIDERPWVVESRVEPRPVMALSLSADHRLVDGDVSTGFLRAVANCLSDPLSLFLELM